MSYTENMTFLACVRSYEHFGRRNIIDSGKYGKSGVLNLCKKKIDIWMKTFFRFCKNKKTFFGRKIRMVIFTSEIP